MREEETLKAIRMQIRKHAANRQRFFLTYVPAAPHYPYDAVPPQFQKFKADKPGDFTPLYLNELLYIDWVLASILDELKDSGLLDKYPGGGHKRPRGNDRRERWAHRAWLVSESRIG